MKLTATQQRVYNEVVEQVKQARECKDYDEYWERYYSDRIQARWKDDWKKYYEEHLNGIASVKTAKHETLKKLETVGLVKVIDLYLNKVQLL